MCVSVWMAQPEEVPEEEAEEEAKEEAAVVVQEEAAMKIQAVIRGVKTRRNSVSREMEEAQVRLAACCHVCVMPGLGCGGSHA